MNEPGSRPRASASVWLVAIILIAWTPSASAQRSQLTPQRKEQARELAGSGLRKYNLGRFEDAAHDFETAYELTGDQSFLFNIAQSYRFANNHERAIFFFKGFLRTNPPNRADIEKRISDEAELLAKQNAANSAPPMELQKPERGSASPEAAEAPPAPPAPVVAPPAAPPSVAAPRSRGVLVAVGGALLGVSVALGAAALGTGLAAGNDYDSLSSRCGTSRDQCPDGFQSTRDAGRSLGLTTWALGSVGGAAAIAGAALLAVGVRKRRSEERAFVHPALFTGGGALVVGGRF
jgi:hypothetical protein